MASCESVAEHLHCPYSPATTICSSGWAPYTVAHYAERLARSARPYGNRRLDGRDRRLLCETEEQFQATMRVLENSGSTPSSPRPTRPGRNPALRMADDVPLPSSGGASTNSSPSGGDRPGTEPALARTGRRSAGRADHAAPARPRAQRRGRRRGRRRSHIAVPALAGRRGRGVSPLAVDPP